MVFFAKKEFKMGNEIVFDKMDTNFLELLDQLRANIGKPLKINSSYRSKKHNDSVGGSKYSQHLLGKAVDIHCDNGIFRALIIGNALILGLSVGVAKSFIHIDNRNVQIVFSY